MCTIRILKNDYDDVIQLVKKLRVMSVSSVPPCPRSVPRVGMVLSPPCERKYSMTPKVSSATPSSCWMVMDS